MKLEPRASIAGHVLDTDNNAVAGVKVRARPGKHEKPAFSIDGEAQRHDDERPRRRVHDRRARAGKYKLTIGELGGPRLDTKLGGRSTSHRRRREDRRRA